MKVFKIIGLILILGLIGFAVFIWSWMRPIINFDQTKIPKDLITDQFINLDRVYMISKFRSGAGHDYSNTWDGETCRSMKHYFNTSKYQVNGKPLRSQPTTTEPNIKIYAPFDGEITEAHAEHIGTQVHIYSEKYPNFFIRIFHIDLLPDFKVGSHVSSGQWIGTIGPRDGTDFSVEANSIKGPILLSMFDAMTDEVFTPFAKMGFKRSDFIISRENRDANPFKCGGVQTNSLNERSSSLNERGSSLNKAEETFQHSADRSRDWTQDFIFLKEDPYPFPGQIQVNIGPPER